MRALLINPFERTITEVDYSGDFHQIYELIDAHTFDCVRIDDSGGSIFVDDEGLINGKEQTYFAHVNYPQPLAGKGLVLGCDMNTGESVGTEYTVDDFKRDVVWVMPVLTVKGVRFLPID